MPANRCYRGQGDLGQAEIDQLGAQPVPVDPVVCRCGGGPGMEGTPLGVQIAQRQPAPGSDQFGQPGQTRCRVRQVM